MMAAMPDDETITFTPDEVKYSVSIFTDIDCAYCRRLHSQIDEYLAQGIEIKVPVVPAQWADVGVMGKSGAGLVCRRSKRGIDAGQGRQEFRITQLRFIDDQQTLCAGTGCRTDWNAGNCHVRWHIDAGLSAAARVGGEAGCRRRILGSQVRNKAANRVCDE